MPRKQSSDEQVVFPLREAEAGATVHEICRKTGFAEATFCRRKKVYAGHSALKADSAEPLVLLWANNA